MSNFDIRLRQFTPAGVKGAVLPTLTMDWTTAQSAATSMRFSVSRLVADTLDTPALLGVEYYWAGQWVTPKNNLIIAGEDTGDSIDSAKVGNYVGQDLLSWLLARFYLRSASTAVDGYRSFTSPGHLMATMITEAQARGWGPNVTFDFSASVDSKGVSWVSGDTPPKERIRTPMSQILQSMVTQGMCEWDATGQVMHLYRPGTGNDRTDVKLGGSESFTKAPVKTDFSDVFTELLVLLDPAASPHAVLLPNPGADTRFGTLAATMTQSTVTNSTEATRLAQPALVAGRALKRELSYDWTPGDSTPVPLVDFEVGDIVRGRVGGTWLENRVIGLVLTRSDQGVVGARAVLGDKLLSSVAKQARRTSAAVIGTIIGGSGDGMPAYDPPGDPIAPTGLAVTSNVASWREDGTAQADVTLGWDAVLVDGDGALVTIIGYEVWSRLAAEASTLYTTTTAPSVSSSVWTPGTTRYVKVRALALGGAVGAFSAEVAVTPAQAVYIIPKAPTSLAVATNVGAFRADGSSYSRVKVTWAAVTQDITDAATTVDAYEAQLEDGNGAWVPFAQVLSPREIEFDIPAGETRRVQVRAKAALGGAWSDPSTPLSVTGNLPTQVTTAPKAPTLTTRLGIVAISWDGLLVGDVAPPSSFNNLYAEYAAGSGGPWTRVAGSPTRTAGTVGNVKADVGTVLWARLVWVDTRGRASTVSSTANITVVGVNAPDMEANSVTANSITVGAVEVQHLANGVGAAIDLTGNSVVTTITGQQATQAALTADAIAEAIAAADAAAAAAALADGATADAAAAAGAAAAASAAAALAQAQLDTVQTWFRVDGAGAHVGQSGNPFQANVLPSEFNITENGVRMTWWQSGQMYVPSLVTTEVALSNHKFEKYGTGTVIRALG